MRHISACLLLLVVGCSESAKAKSLPLEEVPDNVMTVAKEKLPDIKFEQAVRLSDGTYEVIGKDQRGKVREIEISPDGKVLQIE